MFTDNLPVVISDEVKTALSEKRAVIALESTIIAHGMPYPQNLESALQLQNVARERNVTPAICAVIGGELKVGLNDVDIEILAKSERVLKLSRRDLGFAVHQKAHGATTVSTTMMLAAAAGIRIFATGGIGGVHRGFEKSFDVSADLLEFTRSPVAVISAGAKVILDLSATLEYLETLGVPVIGYQCDEFPAFFYNHSGLPLHWRMDAVATLADYLEVHWATINAAGVLIANPIPAEFELPFEMVESALDKALRKADELRIQGKYLTPFLLKEINELTSGQSLKSNMELVKNNVVLACDIAKCLSVKATD
jgi:pseudouridine-5'-phosphate glycosidase